MKSSTASGFFADVIIHMEWKLTAASARDDDKAKYTIGNQDCNVDGWCYKEQVDGRLIEVLDGDL